ncbi:hypothetical protein [Bradyrhizobium yuanmingense]|uniref:hypothetical protein n=1 Tax=Bradyrhizobium yuanmingense TaxID=108015 RepID=UPI0030B8CFB7
MLATSAWHRTKLVCAAIGRLFDDAPSPPKNVPAVVHNALERACRRNNILSRAEGADTIYNRIPTWGPYPDVPPKLCCNPSGKSRPGIAVQDLEIAVCGGEEVEETSKHLLNSARRGFSRCTG